MKYSIGIVMLLLVFATSCESDLHRKVRENKEKENKRRQDEAKAKKLAQEAYYEKYIKNSLKVGAKPYGNCYGSGVICKKECSEIKVKAPNNSDVLVIIKTDTFRYNIGFGGRSTRIPNVVVQHGYIKKGSSYNFKVENGVFKVFFYYGKGWDPNKLMASQQCDSLTGGFIENEVYGKDENVYVNNEILTYTLELVENGNFQTIPTNAKEVF